jgi:LEA14-like dessication related protein
MAAFLAGVLLLLSAAPAGTPEVEIHPGPADTFVAAFVRNEPGSDAGAFGGAVSLNGSGQELPATGTAERSGDRLRILLTLKYADLPADWAGRFRPDTFDYRLRGRVAGREEIRWSGTMRWRDVRVEGNRETVSRFLRLGSIELTSFSLVESEARATVKARNPFGFPLKLAGAHYNLLANDQEVGSGETRGMLLHPGQENTLQFPIELEHARLLGAAGGAIASGGEVRGRLTGELTIRLPGGDIAVPLDFSGRLSLLSR